MQAFVVAGTVSIALGINMSEFMRNIERAIKAFEQKDFYAGLNFATLVVEKTTKRFYGKESIARKEYIQFIREYYWVLAPFMGMNEEDIYVYYPNIRIKDDKNRKIGGCFGPDLAEIIYYVFRCCIHHGEELPKNILFHDKVNNANMTIVSLDSNGILVLPSNIVIGLIAICMTCSANSDVKEQTDCFLTLDTSICIYSIADFTQDPIIVHCYVQKGIELKFELSEYLGQEDKIKQLLQQLPTQPEIGFALSIHKPHQQILLQQHTI